MEEWGQHRRYLFAVAYRLLGSAADAEDARRGLARPRRNWMMLSARMRHWSGLPTDHPG